MPRDIRKSSADIEIGVTRGRSSANPSELEAMTSGVELFVSVVPWYVCNVDAEVSFA